MMIVPLYHCNDQYILTTGKYNFGSHIVCLLESMIEAAMGYFLPQGYRRLSILWIKSFTHHKLQRLMAFFITQVVCCVTKKLRVHRL